MGQPFGRPGGLHLILDQVNTLKCISKTTESIKAKPSNSLATIPSCLDLLHYWARSGVEKGGKRTIKPCYHLSSGVYH